MADTTSEVTLRPNINDKKTPKKRVKKEEGGVAMNARVEIRLTAIEKNEVERRAKIFGMTVSAYFRKLHQDLMRARPTREFVVKDECAELFADGIATMAEDLGIEIGTVSVSMRK